MTIESNLWYPPSVANALDDEFTSTVIDPAWDLDFTISGSAPDVLASFGGSDVRVDINGQRKSWAIFQPGSDGVKKNLTKAPNPGVTITDGMYWARVKSQYERGGIPSNNNFGMVLSATVAGEVDPVNQYLIHLRETEANELLVQATEVQNSVTTTQEMTDLENFGNHWEYIGILCDEPQYYLCAATASGSWVIVREFNWGGAATIDRIGFEVRSSAGDTPGNTQYGIDFFRFNPNKQLP
jgi:hypothetical protein